MKTTRNMLAVVTVLAIAGSVSAATVNWTDAGADNLWTNAANWDVGVPGVGDSVLIEDGGAGPLKAPGNDASLVHMDVGLNGTGALTISGAVRPTTNVQIGKNGGATGTVTVVSGDGTFAGWTSLTGWVLTLAESGGHAELVNNGGTIKVYSEWFNVDAWNSGGTAHVQLNAGYLVAEGFNMAAGGGGSVDFAGGSMAIKGDLTAHPDWGDLIAQWIGTGQFTAYGISNDASKFEYDYNATNPGYTTVRAVPPFQSPMDLYMEWAAGAGLDTNGSNSAATFDVEPDGMDNLLEYALGGNPLIDDAASILPTSEFIDADTWEYVYTRRLDATSRGLAYDIVAKENLLAPDWTHSGGLWETNSAPIDAFFESVTNVIPNSTNQGFIKLEVEASF